MITAVITPQSAIADAFVAKLGLSEIRSELPSVSKAYRKGSVVLAVSDRSSSVSEICGEYAPERLYFADFGISATSERFVGDVILPNAFIPLSNEGSDEEGAAFLENYEEQEDYDFETFGLSIGGVCVSTNEEPDDETLVRIASEYGADVVDELGFAVASAGNPETFELYPLYGVVDGIVGNAAENVSEAAVARNIAAIFSFLEENLSDETAENGDESDGEESVTGDGDE